MITDLELEPYAETDPDGPEETPAIEETLSLLDEIERRSFRSRFV